MKIMFVYLAVSKTKTIHRPVEKSTEIANC